MGEAVQGDSQALGEPFRSLLWNLCIGGELEDPVGRQPRQERQSHRGLQVGTEEGAGDWTSRPAPRVLSVSALLPRMNQISVQSFEMLGNQTTGHSISRRNDRDQGSWSQLVLLLLKLFVLAWTSDALSEEVMVWEPRHS